MADAGSNAASSSSSSSKTRLKRTRTGCFKCRMRRRKCDELKPACKRCLDGGFECQYGTRLSFLEKNAKVASADRVSKPTYGKLRFVVPESVIVQEGVRLQPEEEEEEEGGDGDVEDRAGDVGDVGDAESEGIVTGPTKGHQHQHQHQHQSEPQHQSELQPQPHTQPHPPHLHIHSPLNLLPSPTPIPHHHPLDTTIATPSPDSHSHSHASHDLHDLASYTVAISPSNAAYETALDGLLSLGNDHHYAPPPPPQPPQTSQPQPPQTSQPQPQPPTSSSRTLDTESYFGSPPTSASLEPPLTKPSPSSSSSFQNCAHLPQDRAVQLLRHYRYNIAPWLDIGDAAQTFGLVVPRIAVDSPPVLDALLALAAATLDDHRLGPQLRDHHSADPGASSLDMLHSAVAFAFSTLHRHAVLAPTSWQSPSKNMAYALLNYPAFQEQYPSMNLALSWVTLRLELSVGLINGSPVSIPDMISYKTSSPIAVISREAFNCDREPVLLCAQVLNHCFGQGAPSTPGIPAPPTAQAWKSLTESLNMWYTNRPRDFKPMWEMDESEELFPTVLFTNGAAILANQLYHTSMLLLLQNRPRTLPKEHGRSVLVSPLWHAQRICAISLNNETRTNWDFSLLASFYLAAKRMTYEPQQRTILRGIDRIGSLTGWNVNALSAQLVQEWQPD